jgi:methyl-accepting chemotaxis protein
MMKSNSAHESLTKASDRLAQYLSGSEQVFLRTGDRLQSLAKKAKDILNSSNDAATMSTQEASPVESLALALRSMEAHLEVSRDAATAGASCLGQVLQKVEQLVETGAEFQRIASTLRSLSTSLRVEDGRRAEGFGFASVSADVVRLGHLITSKFDAILGRAHNLDSTARAAQKGEREFLKNQGAQASDLLQETRISLTHMGDLEAASGAMRRDSMQASGEINAEVMRVLVSLQLHDITRQMIEHVIESMRSFATELVGASEESTRGDETESDHLADLAALCRIQSRQVSKARRELVSALNGIARTLHEISARVERIVEGTRHLTSQEGGSSLLSRVEHGVGQAAETLHDQLRHERQTFAAVEAVASATMAMESFVGDIAVIANDVKVVALNALVKAVKTGSRGAVFAILAQAIKNLSLDVATKTEMVALVMREMTQLASDLGARMHSSHESEQMENLLTRLTGDLRGYHNGLLSSLTTLRRESSEIASEVEDISRDLAQQAHVTDELRQVERDLAALGEEAARSVDPSKLTNRTSRWLEESAERYTMESERDIHRSVQTDHQSPATAAASPVPSSGLGENVELF